MINNTNPVMGEKEMLNDLLNQEKQIIGLYSTAITEASCPNARQVLTQNFGQCCQNQFAVFNNMTYRGFYQTKPAQPQDVAQAKQKFMQMQSQL